jgi:hypothetical protein
MLWVSSRSSIKKLAFHGLCLLLYIHCRLRRRRVVVYYKHPDFARKSEAFADLLRKRGFHTEVRSGFSFSARALLKSSPDLWIGFFNQVPLEFLPKNHIFINAEPLNVKDDWNDVAHGFEAMRNAREVWDYSRSNAEYLERLAVPFHFVPFGYAPYYETIFQKHSAGKKLQQDIDVLFCGGLNERRERIINELAQRGMSVHVASRTNSAYGEKLDTLLARSKIVLGIHRFEEPQAQIADLARVDHALSNRLFVVHERPSPSASDPAFEQNVTTCEYRDIPDTCARFLARPGERATKSAAAHEWFKSEYALDAFIPYEDVQDLLRRPPRRRAAAGKRRLEREGAI